MLARTKAALTAATCIIGLCCGAAFAADSGAVYFSAAQLREATAKTESGIKSYKLPVGVEAMVSATRRDAEGQVELHLKQHDLIIPQGGQVTALVGGRIEGNKQTAPDEFRGGKIVGGTPYKLMPGDVLWIPAGTPHQMQVEKGGSFNYIALKFDAQNAPAK
jgi:uncharacterized protein YfaQ (DUF2300 family)